MIQEISLKVFSDTSELVATRDGDTLSISIQDRKIEDDFLCIDLDAEAIRNLIVFLSVSLESIQSIYSKSDDDE